MTLRDWFAGMALQGIISSMANLSIPTALKLLEDVGGQDNLARIVAESASKYADAMLKVNRVMNDAAKHDLPDEIKKHVIAHGHRYISQNDPLVPAELALRLKNERDDLLSRLTGIELRMPEELARLEQERNQANELCENVIAQRDELKKSYDQAREDHWTTLELLKAAQKSVEELTEWKRQQMLVANWWDQVDRYVRNHPDCMIGDWVARKALEMLKERDGLREKYRMHHEEAERLARETKEERALAKRLASILESIADLSQTTCLSFESQSFKATSMAIEGCAIWKKANQQHLPG